MEVHRKVSKGVGSQERIRRQAELLGAVRHPGVVELVGLEGNTDRPVLVTVLVDGPTLAAPMPLTVDEVAGVVGAVAATLGDLHDLGIVHGALVPEHVLIGPGGQPVLCGFGSAGPVGDELQPSRDVAALGRLLRRLAIGPDARGLRRIAEAASADEPDARPTAREVAAELATAVPGARLPSPRPSATRGVDPAHDLRALIVGGRGGRRRRAVAPVDTKPRSLLLGTDWDAVVADGPRGEGDSEANSAVLVATAEARRPPAPAPPPRRRWRRRVVGAGATAGVVVTLLAAGLVLLAPWSSPAADERGTPAATLPPPSTRSPTAATTTVRSTAAPATTVAARSSNAASARPDCPVPSAVLIADVDGDGCPDALRYADGVLEGAGIRWAVGQAGDQVTVGDWLCRGRRTVVLLRPSTGDVFRFDGWAVGGEESVTATRVATVAGGKAVRAADVDRDGCHELVVERGELPPQVVRMPRPGP